MTKGKSLFEKEMELERDRILVSQKPVKGINQFVGAKTIVRVIERVQKTKEEAFFPFSNPVFYSIRRVISSEIKNVLFLSLCIGSSIWWASQPELLNVSQIISKASAYPDIVIVDGIGEISMIRQHGLETIESAYKEILDTQMKMLENVEQKEMIEAAVKESQNEDMHVASEGLPELKAVKAIAVLIGSSALAMILTEVAAK